MAKMAALRRWGLSALDGPPPRFLLVPGVGILDEVDRSRRRRSIRANLIGRLELMGRDLSDYSDVGVVIYWPIETEGFRQYSLWQVETAVRKDPALNTVVRCCFDSTAREKLYLLDSSILLVDEERIEAFARLCADVGIRTEQCSIDEAAHI